MRGKAATILGEGLIIRLSDYEGFVWVEPLPSEKEWASWAARPLSWRARARWSQDGWAA